MRIIEISVFCLLFPLFAGIFYSAAKEFSVRQEKCVQKSAELSKNMMISQTFVRMCEKNASDSDFDSFCSDFSTLFSLDSISVETLGVKDKKALVKCAWKLDGLSHSCLSVTER